MYHRNVNIDMNKLYNSELKREYFETQYTNANTTNTGYFDFLIISKVEKGLNKDVFSFNDLEIVTILQRMESSSVLSIRRLLSTLNDYVKWCIANGKRGNDETYINSVQEFIDTEVDLNKYVSNKKIQGKILDEDQFNDLLSILINPIDRALILCLYNFVSGKDFYEIRSLTAESIDIENNQLHLKNIDSKGNEITRTQKVSKQLIDELLLLSNVTVYESNNGMPDMAGATKNLAFISSIYLFRPTQSSDVNTMISHNTLYTKIRLIKQYTGYGFISPTSLRDTRLVHEVLRETKARKVDRPTKEAIHQVLGTMYEKYGLSFSHMQLYSLQQKIIKLMDIGKFI